MRDNEIGIEGARRKLGELADAARYNGTTTYLTRHGKRVAAIVPVKEPTMTTVYAVEIQGCNSDGTIWQALHPAESIKVTDFNSADPGRIARDIDANQTVAEGRYRIVMWAGADTGAEPAAAVYFGTAQANVETGGIYVDAPDSAGADLESHVSPWGVDEESMERADAELANMGWQRLGDWSDHPTRTGRACRVTTALS